MGLRVAGDGDVFLLAGEVVAGQRDDVAVVNRFLAHLKGRNFARATRRAYAYDVLNFLRFLAGQGVGLAEVRPTDLFDYLDWQTRPKRTAGSTVVWLSERRGAAPATQNRRIAAVRGLFEFAVITGVVMASPVPAPRRTSGLRARRGLLGHIPARHRSPGGRLVRQQRLLPESLELAEVEAFLTDLGTYRDRAMVLLMLLGGLRAAEVRGLLLAEVDVGRRQVRVLGKGGRERVVPVDRPFFVELAAYLRFERPADCATEQCFVVLRGPTAGQPLTEAGMRRIFRTHRARSGAARVRPHRLRHTYGTELAAAGIDLLVLRDLMDHHVMEARLAAAPAGRLLGKPAYHALTYGWLMSGLARAVTGKGMRELIRVELAQPLNTDGLHLGRPPADAPTQTAQIITPQGTRAFPLFNFLAPKIAAFPFSAAFGALYFPGMTALVQGDIPILDGEVPAANGVCTARALARVYGAIANGGQLDGTRFLSPDLVSGLTGRPSLRPDHNLLLPLAWHMGYHAVPIPGVLPGFGHAGMGGSIGWADPASGIAFGFVHNRLLTPMIFDQATFIGLGALLRRGAATARRHGYQILPNFEEPYPTPAKVTA